MYTALIPNGREQAMLNQCLVSVLTQTCKPQEIIIFDDTKERNFDRAILAMADALRIPIKIIRDVKVNSMFAIRERLIKEAHDTTGYCLFVDDDMVLESDAARKLLNRLEANLDVPFAQGLRIEVGGREQNSADDINQVRIGTPDNTPIYYGDTAILMFRRNLFARSVPWDKIRMLMDQPNMGGSDVVITMSIVKEKGPGFAVPDAVGYHFAKANFSYWAGFATADRYIQNGFVGLLGEELLEKVYGGL